jgi:hypothetical protein
MKTLWIRRSVQPIVLRIAISLAFSSTLMRLEPRMPNEATRMTQRRAMKTAIFSRAIAENRLRLSSCQSWTRRSLRPMAGDDGLDLGLARGELVDVVDLDLDAGDAVAGAEEGLREPEFGVDEPAVVLVVVGVEHAGDLDLHDAGDAASGGEAADRGDELDGVAEVSGELLGLLAADEDAVERGAGGGSVSSVGSGSGSGSGSGGGVATAGGSLPCLRSRRSRPRGPPSPPRRRRPASRGMRRDRGGRAWGAGGSLLAGGSLPCARSFWISTSGSSQRRRRRRR